MRFRDKVVLVTGAGRGIGQAIALAFAEEGANVGVNALHLASAEATAGMISSLRRRAIAVDADVAEEDQVSKMVKRVIEELGGIHILVSAHP